MSADEAIETALPRLLEAALQAVGAPEGGQVHTAVVREGSLVLLVDYGIGGIKKWVVPLGQIPPSVNPEAPAVEPERVVIGMTQPSQAPPLVKPTGQKKGRKK